MKKILLAGSMLVFVSPIGYAADLGPAPEPVYDWTGFYFGLNAGAAFNSSSVDENAIEGDLPPDVAHNLAAKIESNETVFTGGGEIGYNWQMNNLVIGAETDFNYLGFDESRHRARAVDGLGEVDSSVGLQTDWYGTVRARLGFASDNILVYGTGGLAYGNIQADGRVTAENGDFWKGSESSTNWGWTIGGGAEVGITPSWTAGAEILYVDLGSSDFDFRNGELNEVSERINGDIDAAFTVVRATAKFKF